MSKTSLSGLSTFKRDFSSTVCSSSSQPIDNGNDWPPSPPQVVMTDSEKRMKAIQDALNGNPVAMLARPLEAPPQNANKRPNPSQFEPPAKKRQVPSSWSHPVAPPSKQAIAKAATKTKTAGVPPTTFSKEISKPAKIFLSQEQSQILKLVNDGNNVFYTGSAGTGKSVLLREIIKTLRKKYVSAPDAVAITASTGIAACNIGGITIHSFGGIGLGIDSAENLVRKIQKNKKAVSRWLRTKVLIIDEVSMVDGDLFDKLARIGSLLRKRVEPFGGIQVIVTGDFFQLPPVMKGGQPKFAFEAQLWNETIKRTFNLTKVFRQRDQEFVDMLNEMRFGKLSHNSITRFRSLSRAIQFDDGMAATELFPRREDVESANRTRSERLHTERRKYSARDGGTLQDLSQREKILANFMAPGELDLRVDAQVMLIKNIDDTLVNGSMGRVVRFVNPTQHASETGAEVPKESRKPASSSGSRDMDWPIVEFTIPGSHGYTREVMIQLETWKVELPSGEVQVSRTQLPLILAWAMSIHKSQGQTLERVKVDLGRIFEKGQAYVALSRATSLEGLQVLNFDAEKVKAHPKVSEWSRTLEVIDQ